MVRDISPPPNKRRKLKSQTAEGSQNGLCSTTAGVDANGSRQTLRIYSWNVNGISAFLQRPITSFFDSKQSSMSSTSRMTASLRSFLRRHQWPDLLCLQEVKIASGDQKVQAAVRKAVNTREGPADTGPEYQVFYTLPTDKFNARGWGGKVYGVATIIRKDTYRTRVKTVKDVEWDKEGRVSVIEFSDKLAVYNVYAVNGTDNPYRDPDSGAVAGTRHDRKLRFHKLLLQDCQSRQSEGLDIIIIGDINVAPARIDGHPNLRTFPEQHVRNRADFNSKFLDLNNPEGLRTIDVWRHLRGLQKRYTYHPRGVQWGDSCDRVDLVLASRAMVDRGDVVHVQIYDSAAERGPSDHVPIMVEIRTQLENV